MCSVILLPVPVQDDQLGDVSMQILGLPDTLASVQGIAAENLKTARRFVKAVDHAFVINSVEWFGFDKHAGKYDTSEIKRFLLTGGNLLVVSESGCPGVGDPGNDIVRLAHSMSVNVLPLPGQCSFLLALMGSGLNGQAFSFHGYLPIDPTEFIKKIKKLEQQSASLGSTQIVMDTPFRTAKAFATLVSALSPETLLCLAYNLYGPGQILRTLKAGEWKRNPPMLEKMPAVFLFQAK